MVRSLPFSLPSSIAIARPLSVADPVRFSVSDIDGLARRGQIVTPHGSVDTPAFMPVGTRASVRALDSNDLSNVGAQMVLSNIYHLMLRPGADLIARMGGLHEFMQWNGPLLTDSGGFQIFSLDPTITEDGASFKSTYDGSRVSLTPEQSVHLQQELGPDIAMVLDICIGLPAPREVAVDAMERTLRWAERSKAAHTLRDQAQFGIVQGGVDLELRAESARRTAEIGFPGYGIGGLSVGEPAEERNAALDACLPELPDDAPRYVMGLGDPEGVLDSIARGVDLFDCVWPTRLARHGKVITSRGDFNIRRLEFAEDPKPVDPECSCSTCQTYSKAYLRHLAVVKEQSLNRLLSIHNLTMTQRLLADARAAIEAGTFEEYRTMVTTQRDSTRPISDRS